MQTLKANVRYRGSNPETEDKLSQDSPNDVDWFTTIDRGLEPVAVFHHSSVGQAYSFAHRLQSLINSLAIGSSIDFPTVEPRPATIGDMLQAEDDTLRNRDRTFTRNPASGSR